MILLAVLLTSSPAQGAYPRVILISGSELEKPVVFYKLRDIANLTNAIAESPSVPSEQVKGRAYFRLSLFWGDDTWEPYVREGRLNELRPEQANQEGRFYPASDGRKAVIDLLVNGRAGPKRAPRVTLATLARHGVPTSLPAESAGDARWPWIVGGVLAGLASLAVVGTFTFRRRSRPASA